MDKSSLDSETNNQNIVRPTDEVDQCEIMLRKKSNVHECSHLHKKQCVMYDEHTYMCIYVWGYMYIHTYICG